MVFLPLGTHGTPLPVRLGSALVSRAVCERAPRCGPSAPLPWVSLCIFTVEVVIFVEYFTHFYEGVTQQPERSWSHHPHCAHALGGLHQLHTPQLSPCLKPPQRGQTSPCLCSLSLACSSLLLHLLCPPCLFPFLPLFTPFFCCSLSLPSSISPFLSLLGASMSSLRYLSGSFPSHP